MQEVKQTWTTTQYLKKPAIHQSMKPMLSFTTMSRYDGAIHKNVKT
jgi:hypothetical protein